jgi:uncharacterized coiled-coil protein SlyX
MSLLKKMLDDAIPHTPLEAEFARQIDKLNSRLDTQENVIKALSSIVSKQVWV